MILTTPAEIEQVAFSGPLEIHPQPDRTRLRHYEPDTDAPGGDVAESPQPEPTLVTIGEPQVWNVADVYRAEGRAMPAGLQLLMSDARFFLIRMACTLRTKPPASLQRVRFAVTLIAADENAPAPVAFDLHPAEIYDETNRTLHVKLAPSLKFAGAEAAIGEAAFDLHYTELLPVVTCGGALESSFDWDMRPTPQHPLLGTRWFHAVVKIPDESGPVDAALRLHADVATPRGRFRAALRSEDRAALARRRICA
jgi:hypothetical protein